MTEQEQRLAIAEACGWKYVKDYDPCRGGYWQSPENYCHDAPPDYLNDLNACCDMEWILTENQEVAFRGWLWLAHGQPDMRCKIVHATARQRAEAFLRTIGKWKEKQKP